MDKEIGSEFQVLTFSFRGRAKLISEAITKQTDLQIMEKAQLIANENFKNAFTQLNNEGDKQIQLAQGNVAQLMSKYIKANQQQAFLNKYNEHVENMVSTIINQAKQIFQQDQMEDSGNQRIELPQQEESLNHIIENIPKKLPSLLTEEPSSVGESYYRQILSNLNNQSSIIAEKIEQELKTLLPPEVTVRAEVNFQPGSFLMVGTVMIANWIGTLALEAAKEAVGENIKNMINIVVKRVFNQAVELVGLTPYVGPLDELSVNIRQKTEGTSPEVKSTIQPQSQRNMAEIIRDQYPQILLWVILILVILIMFGQYGPMLIFR